MPLFSVPGNCWVRAVGTVAASSTNVSSLPIGVPAGVQKGDWLILCSTNCVAAPHAAITGWNIYTNMNNANDGTSGSQYVNLAVFTRVADGTEAASYSATVATASGMTGVILALAGVDPDYVGNGGFRSGGTAVFGTGTGSTTTNAPAAIGGGVRSGELAVFVYGAGTSGSTTYTGNIPFTAPGGAWATQANKASSVASSNFNSGIGVFTQRGQAATPGALTCSSPSKYVIAGATASVSVPNTPGQILTATGRAAFY